MQRSVSALILVISLSACGGRIAESVEDASVERVDSAAVIPEVSVDIGPDPGSEPTGEPCSTPGAIEAKRCAKCGKQTRVCRTSPSGAARWSPFSECDGTGVCPKGWDTITKVGAPAPRAAHSAVWTGSELVVWGGRFNLPPYFRNDGGRYDPVNDVWRSIAAAPLSPRHLHPTVWTGTQMIVWGGEGEFGRAYGDGAAYSPAADNWKVLAPAPIAPRMTLAAVWTGSEMIVWGGYDGKNVFADGARYDPSSDTWRAMAPPPSEFRSRGSHVAVWSGTRMIVFGGVAYGLGYLGDAAAYDPSADKWTLLTAPPLDARVLTIGVPLTGAPDRALLFAGLGWDGAGRDDGAIFDAAASTWTAIKSPGETVLPHARRYDAFAWWGAGRFFIWGGAGGKPVMEWYDNGASYDPSSGTWTPMPPGGPSVRGAGSVVWTGSEAILWGGSRYTDHYGDGRIYRP